MKGRRRAPVALTLPGIDAAPRTPTPTSRATSRPKGRYEAPAPKPWLAVVLGIDTANRSGWAVNAAGKQLEFGEADTLDAEALIQIVRWGKHVASRCEMPLVLALEVHPWVGRFRAAMGLSAARERWLVAWRAEEMPASRVVRVTPYDWRRAVLGKYWATAPRDVVRPQELQVAGAIVGEDVHDDEAPAILIAKWASHAQCVGRAIGKRATKESLGAWGKR